MGDFMSSMSSIYNQSPSALLLAFVLLSLAVAVPVENRAIHQARTQAGTVVPEEAPQVELITAQAEESASPKKVIDAVTASQVAESAALTAQAALKRENLKAAEAMKNAWTPPIRPSSTPNPNWTTPRVPSPRRRQPTLRPPLTSPPNSSSSRKPTM